MALVHFRRRRSRGDGAGEQLHRFLRLTLAERRCSADIQLRRALGGFFANLLALGQRVVPRLEIEVGLCEISAGFEVAGLNLDGALKLARGVRMPRSRRVGPAERVQSGAELGVDLKGVL